MSDVQDAATRRDDAAAAAVVVLMVLTGVMLLALVTRTPRIRRSTSRFSHLRRSSVRLWRSGRHPCCWCGGAGGGPWGLSGSSS